MREEAVESVRVSSHPTIQEYTLRCCTRWHTGAYRCRVAKVVDASRGAEGRGALQVEKDRERQRGECAKGRRFGVLRLWIRRDMMPLGGELSWNNHMYMLTGSEQTIS